jgi:glutaminyl-peptide cyclotransferase
MSGRRLATTDVKNANLVSWGRLVLIPIILALAACAKQPADKPASVPPVPTLAVGGKAPAMVRYTYEVVAVWPHDRSAFTQGLVFRNGSFLESTGLYGESTLREVEVTTGRVLKQVPLSREYFAEGLAVVGDKAYQLTWQNHKVFVYAADTFQRVGEFDYPGEGWGLATDGRQLILSDGTNRIRFVDPATFAVVRTVDVAMAGKPLSQLNELEYINGEIFANVWQTDLVVRIDPTNGVVRGVIDFAGLLSPLDRRRDTDVLNGIAYDASTDRLFVTGKRWPSIFEVRLKALRLDPETSGPTTK